MNQQYADRSPKTFRPSLRAQLSRALARGLFEHGGKGEKFGGVDP
jgi:hypothetical protein